MKKKKERKKEREKERNFRVTLLRRKNPPQLINNNFIQKTVSRGKKLIGKTP